MKQLDEKKRKLAQKMISAKRVAPAQKGRGSLHSVASKLKLQSEGENEHNES
jgi:hypothetical protein